MVFLSPEDFIDASAGAAFISTRINHRIESRQDTDDYHSRESSSGMQASICVPPICYGTTVSASGSVSSGKTDSTYASVVEQTGLYAGKGGFDINVEGNTDLKGAVIASTADKDKNTLTTGALTTSDIENKAEYKSDTSTIAGSFTAILLAITLALLTLHWVLFLGR
ncbi:hemagglutinin repeat-containing protein [Cupriavidus campinensis]|uniref:Uncharacterized protein n=2 Tax=Cupriavidus TaxID=106589 RepID=A0AAE9L544_9BURK|nr:hemagglutinin repeat-containing protein [Cupriavidus campinensis]URF06795.1 hypothetical protein M5D45_27360 [Cupriavidus campinensis]